MGFLCAREYFKGDTPREIYLRKRINQMWGAANWKWHTNNEKNCTGIGAPPMALI
jgi:hypothetical protein